MIGAAGPWQESYGLMTRRGIELAVDEINRGGGIRGAPLLLEARDDGADGTRAVAIAQELVSDRRVLAVVGHVNSGAMLAAAPVYDGSLTAVATSASSPDLSGISPWVFRIISSDSLNAVTLARFASTIAGSSADLRRASILYENDAYGRGLADAFRKSYKGRILSFDPIREDFASAEPMVAYLKLRAPGLVFVAGREASALKFLREARRQQLDAIFLGGDGWQGVVADPVASEGAYVGMSFSADDPAPEVRQFVLVFEARYGIRPDAFAALAYDATRLVAQAINEAGRDRRAVRRYLAGLTTETAYRGITGPVFFGDGGDPMGMGFRVAQVSGGTIRGRRSR